MTTPATPCLRTCVAIQLVLAAVCILVVAGACGKKAPPVPPSLATPQEVTEFSTRLDEHAIVLTWRAPARRKDGSPLEEFTGFNVLRASSTFAEDCPGCPVRFTDRYVVEWPGVGKEGITDNLVRYEDRDIAYGHKYVYAVQAIDSDDRIGETSSPLAVYWDVQPGPVSSLAAQAGDGWVRLNWKAPQTLADGAPVAESLSYYVSRREGEGAFRHLGETGLFSGTGLDDTSVLNGKAYSYKVQAVRTISGTLITGPESDPVTAVPKDAGAPPPPW